MPKPCILVVDDQRDVRRMIVAGLETLATKAEVLDVPSAEEAFFLTSRRKVDVLISDVRLPGITGLDLVKRFRQRDPNIKVVLITGMTDSQTRRQLDAANVNQYFFKPVQLSDFLNAIENLLHADDAPAQAAASVSAPAAAATPAVPIPEPEPEPPAPPPPTPLQQRLLDLREGSRAGLVALLENGAIIEKLGELGVIDQEVSMPAALQAVFASALQMADALKQSQPEHLLLFASTEAHVCLVPIRRSHALLAAGDADFYAGVLGSAGAILHQSVRELEQVLFPPEATPAITDTPESLADLAAALSAFGAPPAPAAAEAAPVAPELPVEVDPEELAKAEELFGDLFASKEAKPVAANADSFWDNLDVGEINVHKDTLSWDQARDMGLTKD